MLKLAKPVVGLFPICYVKRLSLLLAGMETVKAENLVKDKFYSILHRKDSTKDLGGFFVGLRPYPTFSAGGKSKEFTIGNDLKKDYLFFEGHSARKQVDIFGVNLSTYNNQYPARLNYAFGKTKNFRQKRRKTRKTRKL